MEDIQKNVLRDGMAGIIPEKIRLRTSKLGFATQEYSLQQGILKPLINEVLEEDVMKQFIIPDQARKFFQILSDRKITDFSPWRWLNLFYWMRTNDLT